MSERRFPTWWEVWDMFSPEKQCEFLWRMWLVDV